jgi:cell filamentation protein
VSKYAVSGAEGDDYRRRNLLGLTEDKDLDWAEYSGAFWAEVAFTEGLTPKTCFTVDYLLALHQCAFGHLYEFAGKLRTVNLSKEDVSGKTFPFPVAMALPKAMRDFERNFLALHQPRMPEANLKRTIAHTHAELLYIHPFREGNGRTARILANLMAAQCGFRPLNFQNYAQGADGSGYRSGVEWSSGRGGNGE